MTTTTHHRHWRYDCGTGIYDIDDMRQGQLHVEIYTSPTGRSVRLFVNGKEIKWRDL